MTRGTRPKPTEQQKRAIKLFEENVLLNLGKSIEQILLEAKYAPESARQMTNIMVGIKPHLEPFVEKMEKHRETVMQKMVDKVDSATYADLVRSLHTLREHATPQRQDDAEYRSDYSRTTV